jgi:hypothetical protein
MFAFEVTIHDEPEPFIEAPSPDVLGEDVQTDRPPSSDEFFHDGGADTAPLGVGHDRDPRKVHVVPLVTRVQDADRSSNVIFDDRDRAAIRLEPLVVIPPLNVDVPAVDWLDVLAHRRQI